MAAPEKHTQEHWLEQARLAEKYAHTRPASDLNGFIDAMKDAQEFRRRAALSGGSDE